MENKEQSWNLWESRDDDTKSIAQEKSEHQSSMETQSPPSIKEPQNIASSVYSSQVFQPPYPPPGFVPPSHFSQNGPQMPQMHQMPPMPPITPFTFQQQPPQASQPSHLPQHMNGFFPFPPPFGYPPRFLPQPGTHHMQPPVMSNVPPSQPVSAPLQSSKHLNKGFYHPSKPGGFGNSSNNYPSTNYSQPTKHQPGYPPHLSIPPPASNKATKQTEKEFKMDVKSEYSSHTFIPSKSIEESVFMRGDVQMLGDAIITGDTNLQGSLEVSENIQVKNRLKVGKKGNTITQIIETTENNQHFLEIHTLDRVYQLAEKKDPKICSNDISIDPDTGKLPQNNEEITIKEEISINSDEEIVEEVVEIIEVISASDEDDSEENPSEEKPSSPGSPKSPKSQDDAA